MIYDFLFDMLRQDLAFEFTRSLVRLLSFTRSLYRLECCATTATRKTMLKQHSQCICVCIYIRALKVIYDG